ncbi:class I SAM-dependent methyltransferase [Cellulophaga sp. F20128]|uniref:class I SAM-dependent methyltransferase n=1 Tax=Cellulophaga sp. F20128 TaxID=2926413 RepID=UPI001FF3687B|nr:class I SAM-dependent methyltransferase [Cellulophaga sp. F20128]MCK0158116.1 class I SAM-dependent methyltransferase [Cellulophaga sp. F20128]
MKEFLKTKDYSVSKEEFTLRYNTELDLLVTEPQPKDLARYYESEDYISHTDAKKTIVDQLYQTVKNYSLQKKVKLITQLVSGNKSLLDVGAGTGDFLMAAKQKNWKIEGVEPNAKARKKALAKGVALKESLENLPNNKYGVITLWHVLEHLPNLEEHIQLLKSKLETEGTLIIAVPNFKSYDAVYYKQFWAAFDVPRHLWHFSRTGMARIFAKHQMTVVKTKPMLFDAFYVSLLSEKYKTGQQNLIAAFYRGLWSNLSALRSKEYSSIIYIIKKD